ncbi:hypothetical protein GmHk_02G003572 [Glycine max]|nr:hypothetical protein GmHk_02G003572 [Glycine max]
MNWAAPPEEEASLPPLAPSSSEFVGKKSSSSSRLDYAAAIVDVFLGVEREAHSKPYKKKRIRE